MKFKITQRGVFDADGKQIPVDTVIDVQGREVPGWLKNKGEAIGNASKADVAVTNPAKTEDKKA